MFDGKQITLRMITADMCTADDLVFLIDRNVDII